MTVRSSGRAPKPRLPPTGPPATPVREAITRGDHAALLALARSEEARRLTPTATANLVTVLVLVGHGQHFLAILKNKGPLDLRTVRAGDLPTHFPGRDEALTLLRHATLRHPEDFWLHHLLATLLDEGDAA